MSNQEFVDRFGFAPAAIAGDLTPDECVADYGAGPWSQDAPSRREWIFQRMHGIAPEPDLLTQPADEQLPGSPEERSARAATLDALDAGAAWCSGPRPPLCGWVELDDTVAAGVGDLDDDALLRGVHLMTDVEVVVALEGRTRPCSSEWSGLRRSPSPSSTDPGEDALAGTPQVIAADEAIAGAPIGGGSGAVRRDVLSTLRAGTVGDDRAVARWLGLLSRDGTATETEVLDAIRHAKAIPGPALLSPVSLPPYARLRRSGAAHRGAIERSSRRYASDLDEELARCQRAEDRYRPLISERGWDPRALAEPLRDKAHVLVALDRHGDALAVLDEVLPLWRDLAGSERPDPDRRRPSQRRSLDDELTNLLALRARSTATAAGPST